MESQWSRTIVAGQSRPTEINSQGRSSCSRSDSSSRGRGLARCGVSVEDARCFDGKDSKGFAAHTWSRRVAGQSRPAAD